MTQATHCCLFKVASLIGFFSNQNLEDHSAQLNREFEKATADKLKCKQEAEHTAQTISLANRLVGGLAAEKVLRLY